MVYRPTSGSIQGQQAERSEDKGQDKRRLSVVRDRGERETRTQRGKGVDERGRAADEERKIIRNEELR